MPNVDETLILQASVVEDFEDTLDDLYRSLEVIDRKAKQVFDIEAGVDGVESAIAELETLDAAVDDVGDVNIDVDTDRDPFTGDTAFEDFSSRELAGAAHMFSPFTFGGDSGSSSSAATSDGGSEDESNALDSDDVRRLKDEFGEALDISTLVDRGSVRRPADLLGDNLSDFVDVDATSEAIRRGDLDTDVLEGLDSLDMDEFTDSLDELRSRELTDLPTTTDSLFEQFSNMNLIMGDFFRIFAALVPLLTTFVAAMPAAISGLVALGGAAIAAAGAMAAVGGLAFLGMATSGGEFDVTRIQRELTNLKNQFLDAFAPLANQFAPLAETTFDALGRMFQDLATVGQDLLALFDDARGFIAYMEETIPVVVQSAIRLGTAAMPMMEALGTALADLTLFQSFASVLAEMLPMMAALGHLLVSMLGPIYKISRGFFAVATVVVALLAGFVNLLNVVPFLTEGFGVLVGVLLVLVTVQQILNILTGQLVGKFLTLASTVITNVYSALVTYTGSTIAAAASTALLTATVVTLLGVLTAGLVPALGSIATGFSGVGKNIRGATRALKRFGSVNSGLGGVSAGAPAGVGSGSYGFSGGGTTVVAPDRDTGMAVAHTNNFYGESTNKSNVASRLFNS